MTLKIYNTLTHKEEEFTPITPGKVKMYVCGITAYDECHLGHARAAVVFDVIYRYLKYLKYDVTYVRNFTDIDDKIIKKSNETGTPWQEITEKYIKSYQVQMARLGVLSPTHEPKATEHISEMIALIENLIKEGLAYQAGQDVLFQVRKFNNYGKLSHKKIDELESGARIEIDIKKKDPLDFALWKSAKPGEPSWDSPWGKGRPGWHIECSAMSMKYLGEQFDIHGGGRDLMFPHHENEIAQSEGVTHKDPFAKIWIHNGFVNINSEKMSKSLGNFRSIPAILEQWDPEVVRYFLLSSRYASPLDFTDESMAHARDALNRFYEGLLGVYSSPEGDVNLGATFCDDLEKSLERSMNDDFNAAPLVGDIFEKIRLLNQAIFVRNDRPTSQSKTDIRQLVQKISDILGIFGSDPSDFLGRQKKLGLKSSTINEIEIQKFIEERKSARLSRDWKRADEIRKELEAKGIILKDSPDGTTTWSVKPS